MRAEESQASATGVGCVPRLAFRPREAADSLGVCERTIQGLIADPDQRFPFMRIGRAVLIPVRELADWLALQSESD